MSTEQESIGELVRELKRTNDILYKTSIYTRAMAFAFVSVGIAVMVVLVGSVLRVWP